MNTIDLNRSVVILDEVGDPVSIQVFLDPRLRPRGLVEDDNVLVLYS